MSGISLAKRAVRLYSCPNVPKSTNRHNQKSWLRSVQMLGDKRLLAKPLTRETANG